jgi:hypothetical protein
MTAILGTSALVAYGPKSNGTCEPALVLAMNSKGGANCRANLRSIDASTLPTRCGAKPPAICHESVRASGKLSARHVGAV